MEKFFKRFKVYRDYYNIYLDDLWNINKSGFCIGCLSNRCHVVIIQTKNKKVRVANPLNKESYIFVSYTFALGKITIPFIVFKMWPIY